MKIGAHYYFLTAEAPLVDAASGTTLIFLQALTHHSLDGFENQSRIQAIGSA